MYLSFLTIIISSYRSCGDSFQCPQSFVFLLHPDCLTFSALAFRPQFTYAAFHRIACDVLFEFQFVEIQRSSCSWWEYLFLAVMANRELSGFSEADERIYLPSLTPSQEVLARPSVRLSQGDRCLIKVFSYKRAPVPSGSNYYRAGQGECL